MAYVFRTHVGNGIQSILVCPSFVYTGRQYCCVFYEWKWDMIPWNSAVVQRIKLDYFRVVAVTNSGRISFSDLSHDRVTFRSDLVLHFKWFTNTIYYVLFISYRKPDFRTLILIDWWSIRRFEVNTKHICAFLMLTQNMILLRSAVAFFVWALLMISF